MVFWEFIPETNLNCENDGNPRNEIRGLHLFNFIPSHANYLIAWHTITYRVPRLNLTGR